MQYVKFSEVSCPNMLANGITVGLHRYSDQWSCIYFVPITKNESTYNPINTIIINIADNKSLVTATGFKTFLLYGVTGSGKTEVYLHAAAQTLARGKRVLMLVPEINLTPQFEQSLRARLEPVAGVNGVSVMHSALSDGERLRAWLRVQRGEARIVLGTRLAIFAPLDDLGLIVVDEEHDPSYKQQDGLRYSARDLAVWRAHDLGIPVVLGSATPSLESWANAEKSIYQRLDLPARARGDTTLGAFGRYATLTDGPWLVPSSCRGYAREAC